MANFDEFIKLILSKADIVGLVSKYVNLKKKGANYWGCCPFHHEKTPSFAVNEAKQMFYCFGCHTGGNAITFLAKIESIDNFSAMKILAESLNIAIPETEFHKKTNYEEINKKKLRLYSLLKDTAIHYNQNLSNPKAESAIAYLKKREIDKNLITRFGLGYSLGYDEVINFLTEKGYTLEEMKEAGIITQKVDKYFDTFFKRLMIPIIDSFNNVTGFGARLLEDSDFAKYRNSAQNLVFDKSKTLFAINLVKKKKQNEGLSYVIIAEGYFDVIALHKAGFNSALASMGTALTLDQAKMIKNLTDNVYISYDGDSAGQKATLRGLDILKEAGLNVKVIIIPDKKDPDDIIKQKGASYYSSLMQKALSLTAFKIESAKREFDLSRPEEKSAYAVKAIEIIRKLENPVEREEYLKLVHLSTGYSMQVLYKQADLPRLEEAPAIQVQAKESESLKASDIAKEFVLSSIIAGKPYVDLSENIFELLEDERLERIYNLAIEKIKNTDYNAGLLYSLISKEDEEILTKLINYESIEGDDATKYYDCINLLKFNRYEREIAKLREQFNESKDLELLVKIKEKQFMQQELKKRR